MPIIYLKHPIHGTKVATMTEEADADAKNGWIVYNPNTPTEKVVEAAPVNALEVKRRRIE